jgi:hypothetical protein
MAQVVECLPSKYELMQLWCQRKKKMSSSRLTLVLMELWHPPSKEALLVLAKNQKMSGRWYQIYHV